eukprot:s4894_g3.t1
MSISKYTRQCKCAEKAPRHGAAVSAVLHLHHLADLDHDVPRRDLPSREAALCYTDLDCDSRVSRRSLGRDDHQRDDQRHEGFHRHLLLPTTHRLDDVTELPRLPLASLYGEPTGACLDLKAGSKPLLPSICREGVVKS